MFDQAGTVLLTVEGLRLAAGISEHERANRVFDERLLTIEWERVSCLRCRRSMRDPGCCSVRPKLIR